MSVSQSSRNILIYGQLILHFRTFVDISTGAPKLINSDLFLEKCATVPIKTQGVQRSSSGKMSTF